MTNQATVDTPWYEMPHGMDREMAKYDQCEEPGNCEHDHDSAIEYTREQELDQLRDRVEKAEAGSVRGAGSYSISSDNDVDCQWVRVRHRPCGTDIFGDYDGTDPEDLDAATLLSLMAAHHCDATDVVQSSSTDGAS